MSQSTDRAKSVWLLTFGDVVTLLITFFILMIVLNKGEISRVQKFTDLQLDGSYAQLLKETSEESFLKVERNSNGILILIADDQAFEKGGLTPSVQLQNQLKQLGKALSDLSIFKLDLGILPREVRKHVSQENLQWRAEVNIAGHTDNDPINPFSGLRNNWFLSTLRAEQVMRLLYESSTLDKELFGVAGYGEYRPLVDNDSPEGKAKNRRIEILITATFEKTR
ncbi:OmpA/MotB family protein [Thiosulfativibrio zosterae]|uniref:Chemotaxis protein MotB n=1 Tax=Thiosulfativibrio zosterae TaxID=2675053 RepID=A0A6F8PQF9_9GAMM|nr:OmpA family protein [Thiosulfativibrio zosterae]BBP44230.1 chemotaxis protein MotB [Thiosulfativibrio zosterae]